METTYVLLKPLLTEKTTLLKDEAQQVAFYVHPKANKLESARVALWAASPAGRKRM